MVAIQKKKKLIVFDDMIVDIMANKKFQTINKEPFITCRKLHYLLYLSHNLIFLFQNKLD